MKSRWVPYFRIVLNTDGDAHTTTTPCPELASPTRVSGNIGDGCVSPSASLAPANNVRDLPPDHRSSTLRRHSRPCGRIRANALCPDQMLPTSRRHSRPCGTINADALCPDQMLPTSWQSTKKSGTSAIPTRTKKATDTSRDLWWNPRGRPFSPPSRPSGTEPLPSLLYPFSALFPLPSSEPTLFSAGGLFCDLFSPLSSRFSLRSSLSAFRPLLSLLLFSHLACCWSDVAALRVPQFLIHNGYG